MQITPDGITLHGFLARDNASRSTSLRAGRVRYALRKVNNRRMLASKSDGGPWEPLWIDFGAISIEPLSFREADDENLPLAETGGLPEIPESLRITVRSDDGTIIWREIVQHHEN